MKQIKAQFSIPDSSLKILSNYVKVKVLNNLLCNMIYFGSLWTFSYSWNEGETWLTYQFLNNSRMYVYGLLTEQGEQSAAFTIYGSFPGMHKWVVVQIDLRKALGKIHGLTCLLPCMLTCLLS